MGTTLIAWLEEIAPESGLSARNFMNHKKSRLGDPPSLSLRPWQVGWDEFHAWTVEDLR